MSTDDYTTAKTNAILRNVSFKNGKKWCGYDVRVSRHHNSCLHHLCHQFSSFKKRLKSFVSAVVWCVNYVSALTLKRQANFVVRKTSDLGVFRAAGQVRYAEVNNKTLCRALICSCSSADSDSEVTLKWLQASISLITC